MYRRKKGKLEIALNVLAILIIALLVFIISKNITNTKEAAYVSNNEGETAVNTVQNTSQQIAETNSNKSGSNIIITNQTPTESTAESFEQNITQNTAETNIIDVNEATNQKETNTVDENEETNQVEKNNTTKENETKTTSKESKNPIYSERKGVIYLSFDDGPSSNITPKVLDILKDEGVKATFFLCNFSDELAHLVKREAEEGHTVAIHGYSHQYSKIYKSKDAFMDNVYSLQKKIKDATGVTSMYVRFPGGSSNTVSKKYCKGIMTALSKELLSKGFKYYDWNVCAEDAGSAKTTKDVYNYVVKYLKKDRQNMVLMHDFAGNKKGLDALRDIIKYGKKNGYTFMAVDDKTPMFAQHINN